MSLPKFETPETQSITRIPSQLNRIDLLEGASSNDLNLRDGSGSFMNTENPNIF